MIDPRIARELSWASHKLIEVSRALDRLTTTLRNHERSPNMSGLESCATASESARPGAGEGAEPEQLSLSWEEYSDAIQDTADAQGAAQAGR